MSAGWLLSPLLGLIGCGPGASGIDAALDEAAKRSTTLATSLKKARDDGWTFVEGPAGGGTNSKRDTKVITIDANTLKDPDDLAGTLAHELGHALDDKKYVFDPSMDHDRYVRENTWTDLHGESAATISELQVRDDILASGGSDIGISGTTAKDKITLWEKHKAGSLTRADLEQEIAELFAHKETTSDTKLPYWDHYAKGHHDAWVKNNPGDASKPIPRP
jgi:hypothetical protein